VGEGLDSWTLPRHARRSQRHTNDPEFIEGEDGEDGVRPRRMGTFIPLAPLPQTASEADPNEARRQQRSDYAAEMQGEEMEQHLSDVMRSNTGIQSPLVGLLDQDRHATGSDRLEQAADALLRTAQMMAGQLRVSGFGDVAGVMGDVVGWTQQERAAAHNAGAVSAPTNVGMDHLQTADRMARVMGVTPQDSGASPIQRDLTRFGLFVNQALQLGLTPQQTEQVVREAQTSPDGKLQPETRALLDKQVQTTQNVSWVKARDEVDRLEHNARMLPPEITAYGAMQIPVEPAPSHVRVEPNVIVQPEIAVTVQTGKDDAYDNAVTRQSALGGSGDGMGVSDQ
jgi:hypothetical protein